MKKLEKSDCYDHYWRFAFARQNRFLMKSGLRDTASQPLQDEILEKYKFTNCYRALDRTSQFLIKNITNIDNSKADAFLQIILFKLFNKAATWEKLTHAVGPIKQSSFDINNYSSALDTIRREGCKIYSAAYIMPSGLQYGSKIKHVNNLRMLDFMMTTGIDEKVWSSDSLHEIYRIFLAVPSIGKFLALQLAIDCAYSSHSKASEDQFVIAGPGAERGIKKCFPSSSPSQFTQIISRMQESQEEEFNRLGLDFKYIKNRKLQLIDCQNLFCEVDKYLRVKRPDLNISRTRIKQNYKPNTSPIQLELPKSGTQEYNMRIYIHNSLSKNQKIYIVVSVLALFASIILALLTAPKLLHGCVVATQTAPLPIAYEIRGECIADFDRIINFYAMTYHITIWTSVTVATLLALAIIMKVWSWVTKD